MNSSAEFVAAVLAELTVEPEITGNVVIAEPSDTDAAGVEVWCYGATALFFVESDDPVQLHLPDQADLVRDLLTAVVAGTVWREDFVGRDGRHPFALSWPGGRLTLGVPASVWRRRNRFGRETTTFAPWSVPG